VDNEKRSSLYLAGRAVLTPAQRRRLNKKTRGPAVVREQEWAQAIEAERMKRKLAKIQAALR
jgi:hypothetical protein